MIARQVSVPTWLDPIPDVLRNQALKYWRAGDWLKFLCSASHDDTLELVMRNLKVFQDVGCYEAALVQAYTGGKTTQADFSTSVLRYLFSQADRTRLKQAGDPLPDPGPFTLYRGVAGLPRHRRVRGVSWSSSLMVAAWFAWHFGEIVDSPALYRVTVHASDVLFYSNMREEFEFVVLLSKAARPVRTTLPDQQTVDAWHRSHLQAAQ